MTAETLTQPELIPANELFLSHEQMTEQVNKALKQGIISAEPISNGSDPGDVFVLNKLHENDVDVSKLDESERLYGTGMDDEVFNRLGVSVDERARIEAPAVQQALIDQVIDDNQWHLKEEKLEKDINEGHISQYFELTQNESSIPVVNFSGSVLTPEQVESMRKVTDAVSEVTAGGPFRCTNAICIVPADRLGDSVIGSARGSSGVIVISEKALNGEIDDLYKQGKAAFNKLGLTPLESTLTHEFAHLIELLDPKQNNQDFAKTIGWKNTGHNITDDYGNVRYANQEKLSHIPYVVTLSTEDGDIDVNTRNQYGPELINNTWPITNYGATAKREDIAESFVPFIHQNGQADILDPVRNDLLKAMVDRIKASGTHSKVKVEPVEHPPIFGAKIKPKKYTVKSSFIFVPTKAKPNFSVDNAYETSSYNQTAIDDYGNEVTARVRSPKSSV